MNRNYRKALKYRMPTDAEMEAMGCRYLTDEELNELCGGRMVKDDPSTDNVSEVRAEGRDYGSSGSASSSGSSLGGSSGKTSGSSSSGRGSSYGSGTESSAGKGSAFGNLSGGSYGRGGGAGDNSNGGTNESSSSDTKEKSRDRDVARDAGGSFRDNSSSGSSKEHTISSGETLAGITREHFPDLHGQDFVDKVHEIAKENGISNINEINAGDTISISGGKGASAWTGRGGGSSAGSSGAGNSSGGHGADSGSSSGCAGGDGGGGYAAGAYSGSGQGAGTATGTTAIEEAPTSATTPTDETQNPTSATSAVTDAKDAKSSKGGFWGGLAAIGNGIKSFFDDPIGTMKGWFGGGKSAGVGMTENTTSSQNNANKGGYIKNDDDIIKQKPLEEKYGYPNSLCNAASIMNAYRDAYGISDEKINEFMENKAENYIESDGYVKDPMGMSKELARMSGADKFYGYETDLNGIKKMTKEEFISSNYDYGVGEYYGAGKDITGIPEHFEMIKNNPFTPYDSGAGIKPYDLGRVRPLGEHTF